MREVVIPYEREPRQSGHGPSEELLQEMRAHARAAGLMTPHIPNGHEHLTWRQTAVVLRCSGISPLGPVALNTMSPDEGNMFLLGKVATVEQKAHFLDPIIAGVSRSAFLMTEPWQDGGAGADPRWAS